MADGIVEANAHPVPEPDNNKAKPDDQQTITALP
jgi:hypothetical protein